MIHVKININGDVYHISGNNIDVCDDIYNMDIPLNVDSCDVKINGVGISILTPIISPNFKYVVVGFVYRNFPIKY